MGMDSVNAYITSGSADISDFNLLTYWSRKDKVWRKLAKVARGLLNVPTSSTSSERMVLSRWEYSGLIDAHNCHLNLWTA